MMSQGSSTCRTSRASSEQPVLSLCEAYMRLISSTNSAAARDNMQAEKHCWVRCASSSANNAVLLACQPQQALVVCPLHRVHMSHIQQQLHRKVVSVAKGWFAWSLSAYMQRFLATENKTEYKLPWKTMQASLDTWETMQESLYP